MLDEVIACLERVLAGVEVCCSDSLRSWEMIQQQLRRSSGQRNRGATSERYGDDGGSR